MPENHPLLHWLLPAGGDGRDPGRLVRVARAAEQAGFGSLVTPVGPGCTDPWTLAPALCRQTERIGFLIGCRAGFGSPTTLAQQADAFRRFAGGRLGLLYGDQQTRDQRYGRTDEVMAVLRALLDGKRVDFQGDHVQVEGAQLADPAVEFKVPLYFGGASPAAEDLAARRADVQVLRIEPGEPLSAVAGRVTRVRDRSPALRLALRVPLTDGDSAHEASQRLLAYAELGVDEFVLSGGLPHLEVAPRLRERWHERGTAGVAPGV
ncbi:LLM class flavin-dependent oxidoreductase [Streptomyces sp. NPDC052225]|uniref:LLM class flavin-dependent oxidoreductase n=1 Tax=Streptomyces sp. NPDC052225 TaxID=3154949 RepID=UPI00342ED5F5